MLLWRLCLLNQYILYCQNHQLHLRFPENLFVQSRCSAPLWLLIQCILLLPLIQYILRCQFGWANCQEQRRLHE